MPDKFPYVMGVAFLIFGCIFAVFNLIYLYMSITQRRNVSAIFIVGGVFLGLGGLLLTKKLYGLSFAFLDYPTLGMIVWIAQLTWAKLKERN